MKIDNILKQLPNFSLVLPASGIKDEEAKQLEHLLNLALHTKVLGISPKVLDKPPKVLDKPHYHSQTDELRYQELIAALNDPNSQFTWAVRGGYGCARLIPRLHEYYQESFSKLSPKIIVGYSDITALLNLWQLWGWPCIHGMHALDLLKDPPLANLETLLLGLNKSLDLLEASYSVLQPLNQPAQTNLPLYAKRGCSGGNLTLILSSIGTDWQVDYRDKFLFLEDINLNGYAIDRALWQLKTSGLITQTQAIIFGGFSRTDEHADYALQRAANEWDLPIFSWPKFGHEADNLALVFDPNLPAMITEENNLKYIY